MASAKTVSLEDCSTINNQFWNCLCSHLQTLAPTTVSISDHAPILARLQRSTKLRDLFAVVDIRDNVQWTCAAMVNADDNLTVFLLPWQLYCPHEGEGRGVAMLPIIMLQCCPEQLLNSDLIDPCPAEDLYLHFDLLTRPSQLAEVAPSLKDLLGRLSSLHTSCYLKQVNSALTLHLPLSREDFLRGVAVCQTNILSVDVTPLLSGLCQHALTSFPANAELGTCTVPLPSDVLSQLLSTALSKSTWTCVVQPALGPGEEGEGSCHLHTQQINQALKTHLAELGFRGVPQCGPSYFWLDSRSDNSSVKVSVNVVTV